MDAIVVFVIDVIIIMWGVDSHYKRKEEEEEQYGRVKREIKRLKKERKRLRKERERQAIELEKHQDIYRVAKVRDDNVYDHICRSQVDPHL